MRSSQWSSSSPSPSGDDKRHLRMRLAAAAFVGAFSAWLVTCSAVGDTPAKLLFLGNQNIAPIVYLEDQTPAGVAVDIVHALAKHIPEPIEIRAMDWAQAQAQVVRGDASALIQINPTEERKKIFDFSDPLLESQFSIFVQASRTGILGLSSLRGLRVGVEEAGLPRQMLIANPEIQLALIPNFLDGFKQLSDGVIDAVVVDYRVGSYVLGVNRIPNIKVAGEPIAFSYSAIAVKKGNAKLLGEINSALQTIRADGVYQRIIAKWQPTEAIFETREQIDRQNYQVAILVLVVALLVAAAWAATLKHNITMRQRVETRLRQVNRAHTALSCCNQVLVHATAEAALVQDVCQIIVEEAGYRLAWVGYAEQDAAKAVRPVAQAGFEEGYVAMANITWADTERGRGPTGSCIRTGKTQIVNNFNTNPGTAPWREEAHRRGYASAVAIPLMDAGTPLGALSIYSSEIGAFGDEEVRLLNELAGDMAYGIATLRSQAERKRTEAEEIAHARDVAIGFKIQQMLLLDEPPRDIPGLRVAALTIPSQRIAGDFYEFFAHRDNTVDLIVADVMGKGIPAALLAAATKNHFMQALCHLIAPSPIDALPEPRAIVTLANARMQRALADLESFVTLCYARVDLSRKCLVVVDCGHTGVIHVWCEAGRCELVHGDDLPLGVREGETFEQFVIPFEDGDMFVFYSDGITEAANAEREMFGVDRLMSCVRENSRLAPDALVGAVHSAVVSFAGSDELTDDLTCVVVEVGEAPHRFARQEMEIVSDLAELRRARDFVRSFCRALPGTPLGEDRVAELELAVDEAASNIMKHAYHRRTDQRICIDIEARSDHILVQLHHLGDPFHPEMAPEPVFDGSRESGFGLYILSHSVDDIRYRTDERGENCITLVKMHSS